MLPYQLAEQQVKFSAKPCQGMVFPESVNKDNADYLTQVMAEHFQGKAACFDFMLQEKVAGSHMPIDDATVIWSEKDSPFVPVAKINIPPQNFTSIAQTAFCENLSMNPWHGVGKWEPIGSLNRARRLVYNAVSAFRHKKNDAQRQEPTSWCLNNDGQCDQSALFNVSKPEWPLPRCFDPSFTPVNGEKVVSQCQ